jgi:NADPH-dependent 2,4-dienoyl-CoA reductase/sulfur reductase-like enzyme
LEIDGQERILVPEVNSTGNNERFHVEDPVRLRKPDGTYGLAAIAEIMLLHGQVGRVGVLLRNMTKAEVPIGTEVWSIDRTE